MREAVNAPPGEAHRPSDRAGGLVGLLTGQLVPGRVQLVAPLLHTEPGFSERVRLRGGGAGIGARLAAVRGLGASAAVPVELIVVGTKSTLLRFHLAVKTPPVPLCLLSPRNPLRWACAGAPLGLLAVPPKLLAGRAGLLCFPLAVLAVLWRMGPPKSRRLFGERRRSGTSELCRLRRSEGCGACADESRSGGPRIVGGPLRGIVLHRKLRPRGVIGRPGLLRHGRIGRRPRIRGSSRLRLRGPLLPAHAGRRLFPCTGRAALGLLARRFYVSPLVEAQGGIGLVLTGAAPRFLTLRRHFSSPPGGW